MNLRRTWQVARKSLFEMLREPALLLFTLGMPGFFMLINFIGLGSSPKTATYAVWVIQDTPKVAALIDQLAAERYADGRPAYALRMATDRALAEEALKDQRAAALLVFSEDSSGQVQITLRGDAVNMAFNKASVQLEAALAPQLESAQGKTQVLELVEHPLGLARPINDFDAYAPGMMVFAILLLIPQTAVLVGREMREGTLRRLELSLLSPAEWMGGISLAQMIVALVQVVVMFAAALALGFHNRGSLLLALLIGLALAFGSVGMGLVTACFIRNDTDALNTGSAVSMLQVFLSGAFFAMPAATVFVLIGHQVGIFDFLPATHAMLVLQQVLVGGAGFGAAAFRLGCTLLLSLVYFGLGVWIFGLLWRRHAIRQG